MILQSIHLVRFRQHADTTIHFGRGLTGILGPNGAGKSTVLEAIVYALFGADAARGTKQSIRWNRAPARKQAEVVLEFEVGGTRYHLHRTESNASLFEAGAPVTDTFETTPLREIAGGTSAVNEYLPRILGMTLKEFTASYLCQQKDLARLAALGPTERQAFMRSVMGVGRVDEAVAGARQGRNDLAREREGLAAGIGDREPLLTDLADAREARLGALEGEARTGDELEQRERRFAEAAVALGGSEERKVEHDRLTREARQADRELAEASAQRERLGKRVEEATEAGHTLERNAPALERLAGLRKERDALVEARAGVREVESARAEVARIASDMQSLRPKLEEEREKVLAYDEEAHEALAARRIDVERGLAHLAARRGEARERHLARAQHAEARASEIAAAIGVLEGEGKNGRCPTCDRPLDAQYESVLADLRTQEENVRETCLTAREKASALREPSDGEEALHAEIDRLREAERPHLAAASEASHARRAVEMMEESLAKLEQQHDSALSRWAPLQNAHTTFDPAALTRVEEEIAKLEDLDRFLAGVRTLAAQKDGFQRERDLWSEKGRTAATRKLDAVEALAALAFDADVHARAAFSAEEAQRARDAARVAHARAEEAVRGAEDRLARAERALAEYDRRAASLSDLTERLRIADVAASRLADFRSSVASGIRPELEELTSGLVAELTDGRFEAATITEDFDVVLYRGGVPLQVVSGGEEDVAAFALRIATSQMIAERSGRPQSVLILDEPFGAQDQQRQANMLAMIRRLGGLYPQVLLISHVEEVKHACDQAVIVDFDEAAGCCRVECTPAEPCPF